MHLAGWPEVGASRTTTLLDEIAEVRRVVELGRQARAQSGLKLRQPLRRLVVQGARRRRRTRTRSRDELSVKEVEFGPVEATELRVKPNLPVLGPKLGKELGPVRAALEAGEFEELDGGRLRVDGHELAPEEVLVERRGKEGWAVAGEDGLTVALDLALDPELELEGRARELIHRVNAMRKDAGLELTDRIVLTLPEAEPGSGLRRVDQARDARRPGRDRRREQPSIASLISARAESRPRGRGCPAGHAGLTGEGRRSPRAARS